MIKRVLSGFCFLVLVGVLQSYGQQQKLDTLTRKFKDAREKALQEKLYLHIDRNFFLTGEILWFRIYQVDGSFHRPVNLSKVAYVEILDKDNTSLVQAKIKMDRNGGHGTLFLPATLSSGNYVVRAYTQWMKNFSPEYYFHKPISIANPFVKTEVEKIKTQPRLKIEFFPEGGNLVAGMRSKVAFRINGFEDGKVKGFIISDSGDTVSTFQPYKFNLGHFYFAPSQGVKYHCRIRDDRGTVTTHPIPEVFQEGYVMQLRDSGNAFLKVKVSYSTRPQSLEQVYLFVHGRQILVHAEVKQLYPNSAEFVVDKKKIPDGITHFTIFNSDLKPVCERLYFIKPKNSLALAVQTDQAEYSPRRKVTLQVKTSLDGKDAAADLSVSVHRIDSMGEVVKGGIGPFLYLTSDLKGTVESPEYYFSDAQDAAEAADNLMLTHGWRRFSWDKILGGEKAASSIAELRTHIVSASVMKQDGSPAADVFAFLASPSKLIQLNGARSDKEGKLFFEVQDFWGPRKLVLQNNLKMDSSLRLAIHSPFSSDFAPHPLSEFKLPSARYKTLKERSLSMQVQDIYYRDIADRSALKAKKDSTAFYGKPDQQYFLDNYTRFPVMEEVMREYVPGVLVRKRRDGFHFIALDITNKGVLPGEPLVLLDGVPVFNMNKIMNFDPLRVQRLDVVLRNYILGPMRISGMVSYSTYTGDLAGFELDPRAVVMDYEGLQMYREFYSPKYENTKMRGSRLPDQRHLLYWAPSLVTGHDGSAQIEFYTSDVPGTYQVVIEGLTDTGKAGSGSHTFSVKRVDL